MNQCNSTWNGVTAGTANTIAAGNVKNARDNAIITGSASQNCDLNAIISGGADDDEKQTAAG